MVATLSGVAWFGGVTWLATSGVVVFVRRFFGSAVGLLAGGSSVTAETRRILKVFSTPKRVGLRVAIVARHHSKRNAGGVPKVVVVHRV